MHISALMRHTYVRYMHTHMHTHILMLTTTFLKLCFDHFLPRSLDHSKYRLIGVHGKGSDVVKLVSAKTVAEGEGLFGHM